MTLYLIGGAVFFIVILYLYAKNEGVKNAALNYLKSGVKTANKVEDNDRIADEKIREKVEQFSGDNAVNFWMRGDDSKKSEDVSNSSKT